MKILLLAPQPFYQDRGTPIAVRLLATTLAGLGHDVHLLVFAEGEEVELPGVTLHRHLRVPGMQGIRPGLSLKKLVCDVFFFFTALRLIGKHDFHIIHAVEESVFMARLIRKMFGIAYVYDMDSCMSTQIVDKFPRFKVLRRWMESMEKKAVKDSAGVMVVCRSLEEIARRYAPDKPIARIEDVSLLTGEDGGNEDLRKKFAIEGVLMLYVGNLEKYQGIDLLLEAMGKALAEDDSLALALIGGSAEDIRKYTRKTKELGIASKVFFCGPRPVNMLGFYLRQADIVVSPRVQGENTPMKIYSYMDSGRPVLATDLPTHRQVLDPSIACLVEANPEKMAAGMTQLAGNPRLCAQLAARAGQRVEKEYSPAAFERKVKAFYGRLPACME